MNIPFLRDDSAVVGQVQQVAPGVRRLLCGNSGPFTWRGTNTYLIGPGDGRGGVAVLDPGPEDAAHLAAILRAVSGETVTHILVSHTHRDHSPGAAALAEATGAPTLGFGPHMTQGHGGDEVFNPAIRLRDGEVISGDGWQLTALHTPGHCANHLAFAMEETGVLFSADHVMSWSSTVVSPPDGNMRDYMNSLAKLRAREGRDTLYLPGHGPPLPEPMPFIDALATHRRRREARVVAALRELGRATAPGLVGPVYGPMDPKLTGAAGRSLLANLVMLEEDGVVARDGEEWALVG